MVEWNHQQLVQVIWIEVASSFGSYIFSWPDIFPTVPVYNKNNRVYMYLQQYSCLINHIIHNKLTVCSNTNGFEEANKRKLHKQTYCQLISDLEAKGIEVVYTTLSGDSFRSGLRLQPWTSPVSSHSVSSITYPRSLKKYCYQDSKEPSKTSILCSYHIFNSKNTPVRLSEKPSCRLFIVTYR